MYLLRLTRPTRVDNHDMGRASVVGPLVSQPACRSEECTDYLKAPIPSRNMFVCILHDPASWQLIKRTRAFPLTAFTSPRDDLWVKSKQIPQATWGGGFGGVDAWAPWELTSPIGGGPGPPQPSIFAFLCTSPVCFLCTECRGLPSDSRT